MDEVQQSLPTSFESETAKFVMAKKKALFIPIYDKDKNFVSLCVVEIQQEELSFGISFFGLPSPKERKKATKAIASWLVAEGEKSGTPLCHKEKLSLLISGRSSLLSIC